MTLALARTLPPGSRPALVLVLCLGMALAGCDSGRSSARQAARGVSDDVLRVGIDRPRTLDPAQANLPSELLIAEQLFDGLTAYDPATLAVRPAIAIRWAASPDQRHWEFQLRPDAMFANGRQVVAADVKYTLERIARKGSNSPVAPLLSVVTGFRAFSVDGKAPTLAGVSAPRADTVRIDLDEPLSTLAALLASPAFGIVPREAVEARFPALLFTERPVGSGPYQFKSLQGNSLRLERAPHSTAAVSAVEFELETDVNASYEAFAAGKLDWSPVPPDRVEEAAERYGRDGFRPYTIEVLYGLNLKNPKFADLRFREAIVRAIDRDAIVKAVYGGNTLSLSALVPAGVPGHRDDACGEACRHDPAAARALVTQVFAGRPVPGVQIDYEDDPTQDAVAKAMQANLAAAGIPAATRPHPFSEYLTFASSGAQELFHFTSNGAYPSPDAFLTPLFLSGEPDNVTQLSLPPVDNLLKRARSEPSEANRLSLYQQAEQLILSQAPVVPIAQYESHTVVSRRVQGLMLSPLGTFDASLVRLVDAR